MLSDLRRRARKAGTTPGEVIFTGERRTDHTRITLTDFDSGKVSEQAVEQVATCTACRETSTVSWIDVEGLHDVKVVEELGAIFDIHPLVLEDIAHPGQRPKLESHERYLFLVVRTVVPGPDDIIEEEQISVVMGQNWLISFRERPSSVFDSVRQRIRANRGRVRRMGPDYLAYALIDAIVDEYFLVLEDIGEAMERLEERLLTNPDPECLEMLHELRKDVMMIRRAAWPVRSMMNVLLRDESPLLQADTRPFFRDLQDHTLHVVDNVEEFRELLASLLEVYLTTNSQRTNDVMKVLTVIATIFIPLTFLTSVYGMNFEHMPELGWRWSYPVLWIVIVAVTAVQVFIMWRKRWF